MHEKIIADFSVLLIDKLHNILMKEVYLMQSIIKP